MGRLNLNKKSKGNLGQSVAEYFFAMIAILVVVLSIGFKDKMRDAFNVYFNQASSRLAGGFIVGHFTH